MTLRPLDAVAPRGRKLSTDGTITTTGTALWSAVVAVPSGRLSAHGMLAPYAAVASSTFVLLGFDLSLGDQ